MRNALVNLGLLTGSILFSLLLLEFAVRLLLPQFDPAGEVQLERHPDGTATFQAGFNGRQWINTGDFDVSVAINEYGFRDAKELSEGSEDDLFVVGDSFAFGWGVEAEERFSNRLEELLGVPVYNIAVPTDLEGYRTLLRRAESAGAEIGRLIVAVCMENDLRRYDLAESSPPQTRSPFFGFKVWLTGKSAAYRAVTSLVQRNEALRALVQRVGLSEPELVNVYSADYSAPVLRQSAEQVAQLAAEYSTTVLVVPSRGLYLGPPEEMERHRDGHLRFIGVLEEMGLEVVDMDPVFRAGDPLANYFEHDGHWNARGHAMAAQQLAERLSRPAAGQVAPSQEAAIAP